MNQRTIGVAAFWVASAVVVSCLPSARAIPRATPQGAAAPTASADAPPNAPPKLYASAADVSALWAKAKAERKDQPNYVQSILQLAPYSFNLEYRASIGAANIHEHEAELFYVVDGTATMVTGGKLVNEKRTNAENLSGTAIEGGESRQIGKGDCILVPENTPHWFSSINGTLVLMSLHVPRPVPAR